MQMLKRLKGPLLGLAIALAALFTVPAKPAQAIQLCGNISVNCPSVLFKVDLCNYQFLPGCFTTIAWCASESVLSCWGAIT